MKFYKYKDGQIKLPLRVDFIAEKYYFENAIFDYIYHNMDEYPSYKDVKLSRKILSNI